MIGVLIKKGNLDIETLTLEEQPVKMKAEIKMFTKSQGMPKITSKPVEARGGLEQVLPHSPQEDAKLSTP